MSFSKIIKNMQVKKIWFDRDKIHLETSDGKFGSMPLKWFPRLFNANSSERNDFELWADNSWIHWEKIGEDLSVEGFFTFKKIESEV